MTSKERIDVAIAARPQATPGPFEVVFRGTLGMYSVRKTDGSVHKSNNCFKRSPRNDCIHRA